MHGVACGHLWIAHHYLFCALRSSLIYGEILVDDVKQGIECGLDRLSAADSGVAVQNLLKHLCTGHQPLTTADELLDQALRVSLTRMRRSDQIHRNIRINEDHESDPELYPLSISASIDSMSPEGNSCCTAARTALSFLPTSLEGSRRRASSSACRTHSAMDI